MNFGAALKEMNKGWRVFRRGWNGTKLGLNMYLYIEDAKVLKSETLREPLKVWVSDLDIFVGSHINLMTIKKTEDGHEANLVSGWNASQTDMQADDWDIIIDIKVNLCDVCKLEFGSCHPTNVIYAHDLDKSLEGDDADKIVYCDDYRKKGDAK